MTERLIFDARSIYGSPNWRRPLPDVLEQFADPKAVKRHHQLADEHDELARDVHELHAELRISAERDSAAGAAARVAGEPAPEPLAPQLEAELADANRELAALVKALPASAQQLADSVADRLDEARQQAGENAVRALGRVLDSLEVVRTELVDANEQLSQEAWLRSAIVATLRNSRVQPYRAGHVDSTKEAARGLAELVLQVERVLSDRGEREQRFREGSASHATDTKLPSYPGGPQHRVAPAGGRTRGVVVTPPAAVPEQGDDAGA